MFFSHFWTKIWSDNCVTVLTSRMASEGLHNFRVSEKLLLVIFLKLDHGIIVFSGLWLKFWYFEALIWAESGVCGKKIAPPPLSYLWNLYSDADGVPEASLKNTKISQTATWGGGGSSSQLTNVFMRHCTSTTYTTHTHQGLLFWPKICRFKYLNKSMKTEWPPPICEILS